jgi:uncharacterized low-complexity protein
MPKLLVTAIIHKTLEPGVRAKDGNPAIPPKVQKIMPGTVMQMDESDPLLEVFRRTRAVRDLEPGETIPVDAAMLLAAQGEPVGAEIAAGGERSPAREVPTGKKGKGARASDNAGRRVDPKTGEGKSGVDRTDGQGGEKTADDTRDNDTEGENLV